jgi:hypothetical protein
VQVVRIHDPDRRPASWTGLIGPAQFVAFATPSDGTCILFESVDEARAFCETAVRTSPATRFDVFDAEGRVNPPLLIVVHPSRAQDLDEHPHMLRKRRVIAWVLIAAGIALIIYACSIPADIAVVVPAVIGINLVIAGGRLLWFNLVVRETERARDERLARADANHGRSA